MSQDPIIRKPVPPPTSSSVASTATLSPTPPPTAPAEPALTTQTPYTNFAPNPSTNPNSNPEAGLPLKTTAAAATGPPILARVDALATRILPQKRYARLPRVYFFLACLGLLLVVLVVLVIVLPVVLTHKKHGEGNLPLPTGAKTYAGDGTYYGTGMGACGIDSKDSDMICAIAHTTFDAMAIKGVADPNQNPACGRKIRAVRAGMTHGIEVTVVDRCTGCQPTDLDFSPTAFKMLGDIDEGRIPIQWAWV